MSTRENIRLIARTPLLVLSPKSAFAPIQYMGSVSWQGSAYVYAKTHRCIQRNQYSFLSHLLLFSEE